MKRKIPVYILPFFAAFALASCAGGKPLSKTGNPELPFYPPASVKAIQEATFAQAILLKAPDTGTGSIPTPESMEIAEDGRPFTEAELGSLKDMLLSDASYLQSTVRKCPFLATWSLTFIGPGETTGTIYVAKECKQVRAAGESMITEEIDPIAEPLFALIEKTFSK